jgi:outer membrane protein TolC
MEGHCAMKSGAVALSLMLSMAPAAWAQELDRPAFGERTNPLENSVPSGPPVPGTLSFGLREVVDRALKNNLAAILGSQVEQAAEARRLQDRAEYFPKIDAFLAGQQQQVNLAAFGFSGFPGIRQVIGPFELVDARATLSQSILDFERRHNLRGSTETQRAAALTNADIRELVALTAVDLYFQVVSSQSRVAATEAQLMRARVLHDRALDLKAAGIIPGIDVLRAEVEQHMLEQRLIQAKNVVEKQKLAVARAIGLPLEQQFNLGDSLPSDGQRAGPTDQLLAQAYVQRSDALAAEARIRAAEEDVKAVKGKGLPNLSFKGDYGAIGPSLNNAHGTYSMRLEVRMPVFDKTIDSEALEKEAILRQRRADQASLRGRIEMEVRSALLDLDSSAEQLRVARQSQGLAQQQLDQAQDRFSAGVVNNLEVVQAQEAVALADEGVIQGLYGYNIARALLARAAGSVERSIAEFFPGSPNR